MRSVDLAGSVWRIGLPLSVLTVSVLVLVAAVRDRGEPSPSWRRADWLLVFVWLKMAGDAAFGAQRPVPERQWKGTAALLLGLAAAIRLGKYLRRRGRDEPRPETPEEGPPRPGVLVLMPQLGEDVFEGTVTRWLKQVGDAVVTGEPLLAISTDKVDVEIPADASGPLLEIRVAAGEIARAGAALAVIGYR